MAIAYKVTASLNRDTKKIVILDATGEYVANLNTGGYGTPNPARSTVALFVQLYSSLNGVQQVELITGEDPANAINEWEKDYTEDVVYAVAMLSVESLSSDPDPEIKEAGYYYYNSVTGVLYKWVEVDGAPTFIQPETIDYDDILPANKATTGILVLENVNEYLKNDFIANVDAKTVKVTREDVVNLKSLRDCANHDFINKNYLSSQESIDTMKRVLINQGNNV